MKNQEKVFKHFLSPQFTTRDDRTEWMWYGRNGMKYFWYSEFKGERP